LESNPISSPSVSHSTYADTREIDSQDYKELDPQLGEDHINSDAEYLENDLLDDEQNDIGSRVSLIILFALQMLSSSLKKMYSDAWRIDMKRRFDAILAETETPIGLHPKAARSLDPIFDGIYRAGGHYLD